MWLLKPQGFLLGYVFANPLCYLIKLNLAPWILQVLTISIKLVGKLTSSFSCVLRHKLGFSINS